MTTVADIINLALKDVGIVGTGQTAMAEDTNDALSTLNQMLGQWQVDGFAVYTLKSVAFPVTGATSYTIGTGGNVNRARPDEVEGAVYRLNGVDTPLHIIQSFDDYQAIALKSSVGFPSAVHYQATFPLGRLYVYPVPSSGEILITLREEFTEYTSTASDLALPNKYRMAVRFSLAELLKVSYPDATGRPDIMQAAMKARRILKRSNVRIAPLKMPAELVR